MAATLCPHCGTPNRTGSNFCNRCGADLRGETSPATDISGWLAPESLSRLDAGNRITNGADATGSPLVLSAPTTSPFEDDEEELDCARYAVTLPTPAARLVSGVQGLLDPIRVAAMPQAETLVGWRDRAHRNCPLAPNSCAVCAPC
jgi:hypothetical protein